MKQKSFLINTVILLIVTVNTIFSLSAQTGQTLKGRVFDADTHEPLIGATILIKESQPARGATTDVNGDFSIEDVALGRINIQVSYIGYEPIVIAEIMVTSGKETDINVPLKPSLAEMEELVVTANVVKDRPLNSMATVSARSFTVEEAGRYAGGINDPARLVSAYAGVSVGNIQNNSIIVRGNAPHGVSWRP